MKVKYSVIPFIPVTIAMLAIKVMSVFSVDDNGLLFGLNKTSVSYLSIFIGLGLFVICVLFNILDRKTAPVYKVKKNYVAGLFAILSGLSVATSSFLNVISSTPDNSDYYFVSLIVAVFSIPACISLILMSKVHFSGKTTVSGISMLYIFPALWGCTGLVSEFLEATKVSISASDMTPLFCYIFVTLYLFSHSMIVSRIKGRNPVKACFIYGLPAVALALSYGVYAIIIALLENMGIQYIAFGAQFAVLGIYALSFIIEMFTGTLTKDEIEIIDSLPEEEDSYANSYIKSGAYDELMKSDRSADDTDDEKKPDYLNVELLGDFVTGYTEDDRQLHHSNTTDDLTDGIILSSGAENTPDLVQDIAADVKFKMPKNDDEEIKLEIADAPVAEEPEIKFELKEETENQSEKGLDFMLKKEKKAKAEPEMKSEEKQEDKPVTKQDAKPGEPANDTLASSDFSEDDIISQDRLSQIDRLLAELENKK